MKIGNRVRPRVPRAKSMSGAAQGQRPAQYQPGATPQVFDRHQRQRAESPVYNALSVYIVRPVASREYEPGRWPFDFRFAPVLGHWPRLVWDGPLALTHSHRFLRKRRALNLERMAGRNEDRAGYRRCALGPKARSIPAWGIAPGILPPRPTKG